MEIFDYTNVIYYAKLPFLTNGSCFDKWDYNRRGFTRQTNPAGSYPQLSSLYYAHGAQTWAECLGGDRNPVSCVQETRLHDLEHIPPASVSPHSLRRMVLTIAENFNVHRKLFTSIIASNLHITKFGKTKFKNKAFHQSSTFMLLRPFHIYAPDGSSQHIYSVLTCVCR